MNYTAEKLLLRSLDDFLFYVNLFETFLFTKEEEVGKDGEVDEEDDFDEDEDGMYHFHS